MQENDFVNDFVLGRRRKIDNDSADVTSSARSFQVRKRLHLHCLSTLSHQFTNNPKYTEEC